MDIIAKIVAVLNPVEEMTNSISTNQASISLIIPFVRVLKKTLQDNSNDRGVQTMKGEMLASLNRRLGNIETNETLLLSTLLDPRFKDKFFQKPSTGVSARAILEQKVNALAKNRDTAEPELEPPPAKQPKTAILKCFLDILEESGAITSDDDTSEFIVEKYLAEPLITFHRASSFIWWANNKVRFPLLAKLAQQYLSAPPTSVPSERLFSGAGNIYDEKRNRLAPENAETLLFIKHNLTI